ncbi:hypothetical protein KGQ71_00065 [Patescibacteria group bacterium]|nr:hypothetical protein [Patescibacteria group bacterium]
MGKIKSDPADMYGQSYNGDDDEGVEKEEEKTDDPLGMTLTDGELEELFF